MYIDRWPPPSYRLARCRCLLYAVIMVSYAVALTRNACVSATVPVLDEECISLANGYRCLQFIGVHSNVLQPELDWTDRQPGLRMRCDATDNLVYCRSIRNTRSRGYSQIDDRLPHKIRCISRVIVDRSTEAAKVLTLNPNIVHCPGRIWYIMQALTVSLTGT